MTFIRLLLLYCFGCFLTGCDQSKPVPEIPNKKLNFERQVFTQPVSGSTITLVSDTECEISEGLGILLAEYSRQENKLRVVRRLGGAASVTYYDITPEGLLAPNSNEGFLLPEPLAKVRAQMRAAQEAQAAQERAAKEAQAARERAAKEAEEAQQRAAKAEQERLQQERDKDLIALGHKLNANGFCIYCGWESDFLRRTQRPCLKAPSANTPQ